MKSHIYCVMQEKVIDYVTRKEYIHVIRLVFAKI